MTNITSKMKLKTFNKSYTDETQQLFTSVFSDSEGQEEGMLIGHLVSELIESTDDKDIYGYIAIENHQIIGSIFFTTLLFQTDVKALLLSPVAVSTNYQGKGIGQKLILFGIEQLKEINVELLFTYGDPNFYSKVGFSCITEDTIQAPFKLTQPEGWLCQSLHGDAIKPIDGPSFCVEALNKPEYW